ncbi:amino acid ABC transporter permease [Notoacmeibacter sp. MSK16QG-6]|uniref:amino acid ABC transporter permease n=1 Tax=Notoacmeibacter sp. MSK16QG-6 TaxID=2957982 RepID=UPI00209D96F5|nr:amino acid ABC transporter permease [Notoacmeibacter sp. MSK16QG-6]MCP1198094.1 amino acid ABC transporter permease [Notoacmeibacter sp. MSK16QG-6]
MEEQVAGYVADQQIPSRPAPAGEKGIVQVVRKNLFATPTDTVLSVVFGVFAAWLIWSILSWAVFDATFFGGDREACLTPGEGESEGACWAFVGAKFSQFMYGSYPIDLRWRPNLVAIVFALLVAGAAIPSIPFKSLNTWLLFGVFPIFALVMLTGAGFDVSGGFTAFLMLVAAITAYLLYGDDAGGLAAWPAKIALIGLIACFALIVMSSLDTGTIRFAGITFTIWSVLACLSALVSAVAIAVGMAQRAGVQIWRPVVPVVVAAFIAVLLAEDYGLRPVSTNLWGGLMLTLIVAVTGIAASLPLGILLALGRQSDMPAIRTVCIIFIEFWRGVPLITVLFMAAFMLPLLMPSGVSFNQLLRALVGVALFSAAYMAEVIRGGLQAIPKGQYEGAASLGLSYWQSMRMIILPQALKLVIPGIVNTFIGLFKDTSLVYIIGLADLLGTVRRGFSDPNWITPSTAATGLVFAGFVFWLFCFGMSRYSQFVERRLDTGYKR